MKNCKHGDGAKFCLYTPLILNKIQQDVCGSVHGCCGCASGVPCLWMSRDCFGPFSSTLKMKDWHKKILDWLHLYLSCSHSREKRLLASSWPFIFLSSRISETDTRRISSKFYIFKISVEKVQIWLNSDKNIWHFTYVFVVGVIKTNLFELNSIWLLGWPRTYKRYTAYLVCFSKTSARWIVLKFWRTVLSLMD